MTKYTKLFTPGNIGSLTIKNRVVMTAMGVEGANYDGTPNDNTIAYYQERAKGGVGLIITEYTRVNENDAVTSPTQLSMASNCYIRPFSKIVDAVHKEGTKIFVQLNHPGRQNVVLYPTFWRFNKFVGRIFPCYWKAFFKLTGSQGTESLTDPKMKKVLHMMKPLRAPSDVPENLGLAFFGNERIKPFKTREIHKLERQFIKAAIRAKKAGADGIELHAGHGYLFNQFLSSHSNRRGDEYGGSLENRARILKEVIQGIHAACGDDFPISVRLTVDEFYDKIGYPEKGIHIQEGVEIAKLLESYGANAINVTVGTLETHFTVIEPNSFKPGWRRPLVQAIKDAVNIPVIAVGMIRTPQMAESFLEEGVQDFIGLARPLLSDPYWTKKAYEGRSNTIQRCIGCLYCMESSEKAMANGDHAYCSLNPRVCRENDTPMLPKKDGDGRKVIVIGSGPGGLSAAKELALRGFDVTIIEKEDVIGGQINLAAKIPNKERISWCVEDLSRQLEELDVKFMMNTTATKDLVMGMNPYAVIVATGAYASKPHVPGADLDYVTTVAPILNGDLKLKNEKVVVVGAGMTGLETAQLLAEHGNEVSILRRSDRMDKGTFNISFWDVMQTLDNGVTKFLPGKSLVRIEDHYVYVKNKDGEEEKIYGDHVVLSLGSKSDNSLYEELKPLVKNLYIIGDAKKSRRIFNAVYEGFDVARNIA